MEQSWQTAKTVDGVVLYLQRWLEVQQRPSVSGGQRDTEVILNVKWQKPMTGWIKCNTDAAIFQQSCRMGAGCVLRDVDGLFLSARACSMVHPSLCPRLAEALSFREALSWLKSKGSQFIEFELDALGIVQAVLSDGVDDSQFGLIIEDCKLILSEIRNVKVSFVRKSANQVAHKLARASVFLSDIHIWEVIPPFICNSLSSDLE